MSQLLVLLLTSICIESKQICSGRNINKSTRTLGMHAVFTRMSCNWDTMLLATENVHHMRIRKLPEMYFNIFHLKMWLNLYATRFAKLQKSWCKNIFRVFRWMCPIFIKIGLTAWLYSLNVRRKGMFYLYYLDIAKYSREMETNEMVSGCIIFEEENFFDMEMEKVH